VTRVSGRHLHPRRAAALAVTAVIGAGAAAAGFALAGRAGPPPAEASVSTATAPVQRTTLTARQVVTGTLGFGGSYTVVAAGTGGLLTAAPAPGAVITRGEKIYAADGAPTLLLYGRTPAWRDLVPGTAPGADVAELRQNLAALGYLPHSDARGGQFDSLTELAVERWQQALGLPVTGIIPLGQVAFLPGPLRVTAVAVAPGAPVTPGAAVVAGTSATPQVLADLSPDAAAALRRGDTVRVTMPDGSIQAGIVQAVSPVAVAAPAASSGASGSSPLVIPVTIGLSHPGTARITDQAPVQVAITTQQAADVLAVPVTALLARQGGGYAVETDGPQRRIIPVTTGLFDDDSGLVQVSGPSLRAGQLVEVAGQ